MEEIPFNIPVSMDGGSEGLFRITMYGRLPISGSLGGPGGNLLGFLVHLKMNNAKNAKTATTAHIMLKTFNKNQ